MLKRNITSAPTVADSAVRGPISAGRRPIATASRGGAEPRRSACTGTGSWTWIEETDSVDWSRELYRISPAAHRVPSVQGDWSPAGSCFRKRKAPREAFEACRSRAIPYESYDLELVRPDGAVRQVVARGEPLPGPDGKVSGMRGTVHDITQRKRAEEIVRRDGERVETLSRVAWRLAERLDLEGVLEAVCEETAEALHVPAAIHSFYDPASRTFRHGAASGLGQVPGGSSRHREASSSGSSRSRHAVVVVPDLRS